MKTAKKTLLTLLCVLLLTGLFPSAASAASSGYTIDKVNYIADLRSDGSALITEEWTVTFSETGADGFVSEIAVVDDNFERIGALTDLSVSADGSSCSPENTDTPRKGTYSFTESDDGYTVTWHLPSQSVTHVFSMRYVVTDAVKAYHEQAYFYFRLFDEKSKQLCRNVTAEINAPSACFPEEITILESGSLAGEKSDGKVLFSAVNSAGLIRAGITLPLALFDASRLTLIEDDTTAATAGGISGGVILLILLVVGIYLTLRYQRLFCRFWERKCRKKAYAESSYRSQEKIFLTVSPAQWLRTVTEKRTSEADFFLVTLLDLVRRGYITASPTGFSVCEEPESDPYRRPLSPNEKRILEIFSSDEWEKLLSDPEHFYAEITAFNKKVRFYPFFWNFTSDGRKLIHRSFELALSAGRYEYISPDEISDDFFRLQKYSVPDLLIALLNESSGEFETTDPDRFERNMFRLRHVYEDGARLQQKKKEDAAARKKEKR